MEGSKGFGFGEKKEIYYSKYIDKWGHFYLRGQGTSFSGKLVRIEEGHLILNPFSGGIWHKKDGLVRTMINEDCPLIIEDLAAIEPTTEESLLAYNERTTKENRKHSRKSDN